MKPVSVLYRLSLMYETNLSPRPLVSGDVFVRAYISVHVSGGPSWQESLCRSFICCCYAICFVGSQK